MDPDQELFVIIQKAAGRLLKEPLALLKGQGLSSQQYNVLRILRGANASMNCTEIGSRMINRDPDITRLLDRMEAKGWIERSRDGGDRRVVLSSISRAGLDLLAELDRPILECHRRQFAGLDKETKRLVAGTLKLFAD
ncbi:MAG: MarR family transcriptional regulator [Candidatus Solibacter sp.]|nr:MarR family transcriptional regulator [Candidatus Solibacter sp.]